MMYRKWNIASNLLLLSSKFLNTIILMPKNFGISPLVSKIETLKICATIQFKNCTPIKLQIIKYHSEILLKVVPLKA